MSKQSIYRTVGVYPAQQFFHVESDGSVRLVASLTEDAQRNVVYQVSYRVLVISSFSIESFSFCWFLCLIVYANVYFYYSWLYKPMTH